MKLGDICSLICCWSRLDNLKAGTHVTYNCDALAEDLDQNGDSLYVICQAHVVEQSDSSREDRYGSFRGQHLQAGRLLSKE